MKISIVVPVYNEEKSIEKCLISLTSQTEKPYEIILVDNNCKDKTIDIARKFGVKVIKEKKQGMIFARNAGYSAAKGDIIARTDADTRVPPDWTKRIGEAFEKDPDLLAFSGSAHFYGFPDLLQLNSWPATGSSGFIKFFMGHDGMLGFNLALRKKAWEKIKNDVCMDDKIVHEDADTAIHIARLGKVLFDKTLKVETSSKQLTNLSTGIEYLIRGFKTVAYHKGKNAH